MTRLFGFTVFTDGSTATHCRQSRSARPEFEVDTSNASKQAFLRIKFPAVSSFPAQSLQSTAVAKSLHSPARGRVSSIMTAHWGANEFVVCTGSSLAQVIGLQGEAHRDLSLTPGILITGLLGLGSRALFSSSSLSAGPPSCSQTRACGNHDHDQHGSTACFMSFCLSLFLSLVWYRYAFVARLFHLNIWHGSRGTICLRLVPGRREVNCFQEFQGMSIRHSRGGKG